MLTQEELEKCENPYEEIAKMANGLVEELKEKEYDRGYEKGMEDAWETFKKIELAEGEGGLATTELLDIFGTYVVYEILNNNSAKEAKEKIDNYIKKNAEFHVGDEVINILTNRKYVFVDFVYSGEITTPAEMFIRVIGSDGASWVTDLLRFKKTGRHFDEVEKLLKMLKED